MKPTRARSSIGVAAAFCFFASPPHPPGLLDQWLVPSEIKNRGGGELSSKLWAKANRLEDYVLTRKNLLISGGTGSGKTTLAASLGGFIPPEERLLLIEDTAEIQLPHQNQVRFEARREQNGLPAITIRDLLKAALRHRPDRILLGEIRGGEAFDLLQLLNTGHSGTLSTIHANSAKQGLARFTSCVLQSDIDQLYAAIKTNIADSLNVVIQVERRPGRRFISEVQASVRCCSGETGPFRFCARIQRRELSCMTCVKLAKQRRFEPGRSRAGPPVWDVANQSRC